MRRALVGVSLMSDSMEARAPSAVRVSMISPMSMKNATTPAVLYIPCPSKSREHGDGDQAH